MIAVFCGSRDWKDPGPVRAVMESLADRDLTVVHGDQRGADLVSDTVARSLGLPVVSVPAEWEAYGLAAGPERNERMRQILVRAGTDFRQPVACYAFHEDPKLGSGTRDMVRRCMKSRIRCYAFLSSSRECFRASGDVECAECGLPYRRHPPIISELDSSGHPFLELGCGGEFMKL